MPAGIDNIFFARSANNGCVRLPLSIIYKSKILPIWKNEAIKSTKRNAQKIFFSNEHKTCTCEGENFFEKERYNQEKSKDCMIEFPTSDTTLYIVHCI
jgi:hypothetical protein